MSDPRFTAGLWSVAVGVCAVAGYATWPTIPWLFGFGSVLTFWGLELMAAAYNDR